MSRTEQKTPDFSNGPRFPVKQLVWNIVRGNMIFSGGLYCLVMCGEIFQCIIDFFYWGGSSVMDLSEEIVEFNSYLIVQTTTDGLAMNLLLTSGSIVGIVWYVIARRIETRHAKKRWLVYMKSREPELS